MTPEKEDRLFAAVKEVGDKVDKVATEVQVIKTGLDASQREIASHRLMLSGRPGNGRSEGLGTRVSVLETTQEAEGKSTKWFKKQLAFVIVALVGSVGLQGYNTYQGPRRVEPAVEKPAPSRVHGHLPKQENSDV